MDERIKVGTILVDSNDETHYLKVSGILEEMIFTRRYTNEGVGPYEGPHDPEDLFTFGFKVKE